jgi:hypothetical protein
MGGRSIDLCWLMIMCFPRICMPVPALSRLSAISSFSLTTQANAIGLETEHQPESSPGARPIALVAESRFSGLTRASPPAPLPTVNLPYALLAIAYIYVLPSALHT